ncbi:MAG: AmmeMemoRadiSam system protein B [bacterium]
MSKVYSEDIRQPAVADSFYPGDPETLDKEIDYMLNKVETFDLSGEIKALVSPHAGYIYSGLVAAVGYKHLENRNFSVVAIISPSHREYFPGVSVFNGKGYETPMGLVPIASELANALIEQNQRIISSWLGHRDEHALEVQLPFLQKVLKEITIIPIVMGEQNYETCILLGEALATVLKGVSALIVASSDLSHYHPYPEAVRIDQVTIDLVESFNEVNLMKALENGTSEACGGGPIVSAMRASKIEGANNSKVLMYKNSGDITGDHSAVVGYLSAAFCKFN